MEEKTNKNERFLHRYDTVFAFLGLECIALILFGFGGSLGSMILKFLALFLAFAAFPFVQKNYDSKTIKKNAVRLLPLFLFFLLLGISAFWKSYYGNAFVFFLMGLFQGLGFIGIFGLGFALKNIGAAKIHYVLYAFLGGALIYVLIASIYSAGRYGLFYAAKYVGKYYYFDGVLFPVFSEIKSLVGFEFKETSLQYGMSMAFLLASSGAGLFFADFKKNAKRYAILGAMSLVGILALAMVPYVMGLILLVGVYLLAGLIRLGVWIHQRNERLEKRISFGVWVFLMVVAATGVVLFMVDAKTDFLLNAGIPKLSSALAGDNFVGLIRKTLLSLFYPSISDAGFRNVDFTSVLFGRSNLSNISFCNTFEFNILYENGLITFLLLLFVVFVSMMYGRKFLFKDGVNGEKGMIIASLIGIFVYFSFCSDEMPLVHDTGFFPVTSHPLFIGAIVLLGYIYEPSKAKEAEVKEEVVHE